MSCKTAFRQIVLLEKRPTEQVQLKLTIRDIIVDSDFTTKHMFIYGFETNCPMNHMNIIIFENGSLL